MGERRTVVIAWRHPLLVIFDVVFMFVRHFCSSCFLQNVFGTQPFRDYCQRRGIPFTQEASVLRREDLLRWVEALAQVPQEQQAQIELELARVSEVGSNGAIAQLLAVGAAREVPVDSLPGGTALALWHFLHNPGAFHEAFLHQEVEHADAWWSAQAIPDRVIEDLPRSAAALAESLREVFQRREGAGHFCAVDAQRLNGARCFVAHVSDRLQFLEVFTPEGEFATRAELQALPLVFVYYPIDGTILVQTRLRSRDRVVELAQVFGRVVLGVQLDDTCVGHAFHLDRLKEHFDPLPDAADMERIRVKTLHLRYPAQDGRRQVKLETLTSDEQFAIQKLLETHVPDERVRAEIRVCYAELQMTLKMNGGSKSFILQLWPNRCNLGQSSLHERFRTCLRSWGLLAAHVREP